MRFTLLREQAVRAESGTSRSKMYDDIARGLWTKPVKISRASGWPAYEVEALNAARIAGKSDEEIHQLVERLESARKSVACDSMP
jgi:prophage regulatory protein